MRLLSEIKEKLGRYKGNPPVFLILGDGYGEIEKIEISDIKHGSKGIYIYPADHFKRLHGRYERSVASFVAKT